MSKRRFEIMYSARNKYSLSRFSVHKVILKKLFLIILTILCVLTIYLEYVQTYSNDEAIVSCSEEVELFPIMEEAVLAAPENVSTEYEVSTSIQSHSIKPKNLDAELFNVVTEECENLNIPINFVLAVMKTETQDFNVDEVGYNSNGTCDSGIMQINSSNIQYFADRYNIPEFADNPKDPIANLRVGIRHLAENYHTYLCQYEGDIDKAILAASGAYNRGAYNQNKYRNIYDYNARVYKHYTNLENGLDISVNYQTEIPVFKEELQRSISLEWKGVISVVKSRIVNIESSYDELIGDLFKSYDRDNQAIYIEYTDRSYKVNFSSLQDKINFVNELFKFSISLEDQHIVSLRYGLQSGKPLTFGKLGEQLNMTDEGCRNRIRSSFRKIKHRLNVIRVIERLYK